MNTNAYWRNVTSQRAVALNNVYKQIIANHSTSFFHFDMFYFDFPMPEIINIWTKRGGHVWDLIEPVDGFHPSQIANSLLTEVIWSRISSNYTYLINPINPNNELIYRLFGDQGGY